MEPIAWFLKSANGCIVEVHRNKACIESMIDFENKSQVMQGVSKSNRYEGPFPLYYQPAQAVDLDKLRALADRWATDRSYSGSPADDLRAWIDSQAVGK